MQPGKKNFKSLPLIVAWGIWISKIILFFRIRTPHLCNALSKAYPFYHLFHKAQKTLLQAFTGNSNPKRYAMGFF
jgi:hypothetical protein